MNLLQSLALLPGSQMCEVAGTFISLVLLAIYGTRLIVRNGHNAVVSEKDAQIALLNRDLQSERNQNSIFAGGLANLQNSYATVTCNLAAVAALNASKAATLAGDVRELSKQNAALSAEVRKKEDRADVGMIKSLLHHASKRIG